MIKLLIIYIILMALFYACYLSYKKGGNTMKLSDVVRGVEEKDKYDYCEEHASWGNPDDSFSEGAEHGRVQGYNSLASAEVVVDKRKIIDAVDGCSLGLDDITVTQLSDVIATAIESGSIISLKEKDNV